MAVTPFELPVAKDGAVVLPLALLAQAGLNPGDSVLAVPGPDGVVTLRRLADAETDLLAGLPPV